MIPLIGLQQDEIVGMWPHVRPFVEKAMERTGVIHDVDPEYVLERLKTFDMQCWIGHENDRIVVVHISQIQTFEKRNILCIPFTAAVENTIADWLDHIEIFKDFAKAHDCAVVRGGGRLGWIKKLKPDFIRVQFDIEV